MNIMIINHYAGSDKYGMEFRPLYLGRELVKLGHEVTVIAADYSHLRIVNPKIEKSFTEEYIDGVRYVFVKTIQYKRNNLKRFLNMMSFLNALSRNSKNIYDKYRPDLVVASSTYLYDVKAAKKIAQYNENTKVCYEIHDIWPLSLMELYHLSAKNPYIKSLQKAENYAYENSDMIVSILPHVNRHIEELGYVPKNYSYIPNGVIVDETKHTEPPKKIVDEINKLKADGKFILMYLGGFSKANALDDLFESSKQMPSGIQIVLIGDGPLKEEYIKQIEELNINNVSILDSVLKTSVNHTLKLADCLYIGAKRSKLYQYGVGMNKIFDYMLSKRPIIYGIESSNDIIADAFCGITVEPENPKAIVDGVKKIYCMPIEDRNKMGENGYHYVLKNHDYKNLAKKFAIATGMMEEHDVSN